MKIAIVGTGISGLTSAYLLHKKHEVHLFEANDYIGGHTSTITVNDSNKLINVDTGFIVFNEQNYPNLCRLFDKLGVASRLSDMSFSVHNEKTGLEYNGSGLNGLFCQRRNLLNVNHWLMLKDIMRFHQQAAFLLSNGLDDKTTVTDFALQYSYSSSFVENYLVPLGASLWSAPARTFREFPIRFVLEFMDNHCMLQVRNRPNWKTVTGGSRSYIKPLINGFSDRIRLKQPVSSVHRISKGVELRFINGMAETFDEVIIATHADQALILLAQPSAEETELLQQFPYQDNETVLHTDTSVLPDRPEAWASWNYRIPATDKTHVSVTYNMNLLQGLETDKTYCVSLNQTGNIDSARIIRKFNYHHPLFQPGRQLAQSRHAQLIRHKGLSFCGAYWGYGFHEDGVRSALAVCAAFGQDLNG
jgi:predicted NAD/FAD-binding protein